VEVQPKVKKKPVSKVKKETKKVLDGDQVENIRKEYKAIDKDINLLPDFTVDVNNLVRVGDYDDELHYHNYKIKRYDHNDIPVIEISDLESAWMVRIPFDCETYQIANMLIDAKEDNELIDVFITNLRTVSGIPNGYYHQAILMLTMCYVNPSLLSGGMFLNKEQRQFRKDVKSLRKMFLGWYAERKELEDRREQPGVYDDYYLHRSEDVLAAKNDEELKKIVVD
jgi:hypothetical protein